ncbi:styrene monooxygenase/indole monooxygenase family protein [Streptomyces sp. BBFR2]|uniref:styrene monooxygenase/indole monooxygenase family protein n=1 Tax=Streptomyces sp. BBFR2 TaxID=3372854 RepID=UPI0037DA07CA
MTRVGIIGAGISGLQLALRLQQLGVAATVYSPQDADGLRGGRPRSFPARFAPTQERERRLGVAAWDFPDAQVHHWSVTLHDAGPRPAFSGRLVPPSSVVDFRLYLPHLLNAFTDRGGALEVGEPTVAEVSRRHELTVVANGSRSVRELFPPVPERSPYTTPQRVLCSGVYFGFAEPLPHSLDIHFLPGAGEILRMPFHTPAGRADVLGIEAVPGGPLEAISRVDPEADPKAFHRQVLDLVAQYAPSLREQADTGAFSLIGPGEVARGGITPVVRRGWVPLGDDRCALAIGDAWITNDPLTAQGANLGSRSAFTLAELIAAAPGPLGEEFCRSASAALWDHARHVVAWSNAFLAEPEPQVTEVFAEAARDPRVADAFISSLHDPVGMWRTLATPEGAAAFLARHRGPGPAPEPPAARPHPAESRPG